MRSPITTHVLDTNLGKPAAGIDVTLFRKQGGEFVQIAQGQTNDDGRIIEWMSETERQAGEYQIRFATDPYFQKLGQTCFYPSVTIDFRIEAVDEHYHVPLLVSAYGFSTYRGS